MVDAPKLLPPEQALPAALALRWREQPLPGRVAHGCGLGRDAVVGDLAHPVRPNDGGALVALRYFVLRLVTSRGAEATDVRVFPAFVRLDRATLQAVWPAGRWQALARSGLLEDPARLGALTYADLFAMKGLGAKLIIQLGLRAEALRSPWGETALAAPGPVDAAGLAALKRLAGAPGAQQVSGADKRFAGGIPDNGEPLAGIARALIDSQQKSGRAVVPDGTGGWIAGPVKVLEWVARMEAGLSRLESLPLEASLAELFELYTGYEGQRRDALMSRLGWVGRPLALAEAGRMVGVTRERLRQVEEVARARLPTTALYIPALKRAVEVLTDAAPMEVEQAAQLLQERGICATAYSPDGVIAAARDLQVKTALGISEARGYRLVSRDQGPTAAILYSARRMVGHKGIGRVVDVAEDVSQQQGAACTAQDVKLALRASARFKLLCGTWYWVTDLPKDRNTVAKVCSDVLCVRPLLPVARLWEGLKRYYTALTLRSPAVNGVHLPPLAVLREFLQAHPDFRVDAEDRAALVQVLDFNDELQPAQRALVQVLRLAPGGVLSRGVLTRECARLGVSVAMVTRELKSGYLFERAGANMWGVIGTGDPAAGRDLVVAMAEALDGEAPEAVEAAG